MLEIAVGLGIGQVLIFSLLIRSSFESAQLIRLCDFLAVCICAYLLCLLPALSTQQALVADIVARSAIGFFVILCLLIFKDKYSSALLWLAMLPSLAYATGTLTHHSLLDYVVRPLELIYSLAALWLILVYARNDLVEGRRKLRLLLGFPLFIVIDSIVISIAETWFDIARWIMVDELYLLCFFMLFLNKTLLSYLLSDNAPTALISPDPAKKPTNINQASTAPKEEDAVHILALQDLMASGLYRKHGLTIGELAEGIQLPEYRLRKLINQNFHYRNFTDFLNTYRLEDVVKRFADPDFKRIPILTIALEAGFSSLSPFNRAFKERYNQSPSAYRKDLFVSSWR